MATEEEKTFDNFESEGTKPANDQNTESRPRFSRPSDGTRPQRPRFSRESGAPRYQRVDQRPYQPRTSQGEGEDRPRYSSDSRGYGEDRPRYSQGGSRPYSRDQRPYSDRFSSSDSREDRPYQPRYSRDDQQRPSYSRDDQQRPSYNSDDQQRPSYNRDERPSYSRDERPSYNRDERRPYSRDDQQRPSYGRPQRSYSNRYEQGNTWGDRHEEGGSRPQRRSFGGNQGNGGNGGYRQQGGGFGNRPQQKKKSFGANDKYSKKKQIQYREEFSDPNEEIRLNKYLANAGVCSRREADEFITAGVVSVNGVVVTELGTKVKRGDEVRFHEQPVSIERKIYILLNKPKDYVTTVEDPQDRKTVMDLVKGACKERIYPVGRLDRNTTGVLLLTNDGEMAAKLTHPSFMKKKVYHARLDKAITTEEMEKLLEGIQLEDGEIKVDAISYTTTDTDHTQVGIEIHSGRNRIVRRMFEAIGYHVVRLDRTQFAGLTKKNLRRGDWRFLNEKEVSMLRMGNYE